MGMDLDYLVIRQSLDKLEKIVRDKPHGKREKIADDIVAFVEEIKKKYK